MKITTTIFLFLFSVSLHAMTKEWVVTKLNFDDAKKLYLVEFKNQAGIYKAEEKWTACLRDSLENQKNVKVDFDPMGLKIRNCGKGTSH